MTDLHFTPRARTIGRAGSIAAALLSLSLVAACEGSSGGELKTPVASTAGLAPAGGASFGEVETGGMNADSRLKTVGDRVRFELDGYSLTPEAERTLQEQAAVLQEYQQAVVTIEGHADERGTREYNLALGERRADTVRNYLIALGVNADRISVVSYGKERPECADADENCWALNRRGVTVASQ